MKAYRGRKVLFFFFIFIPIAAIGIFLNMSVRETSHADDAMFDLLYIGSRADDRILLYFYQDAETGQRSAFLPYSAAEGEFCFCLPKETRLLLDGAVYEDGAAMPTLEEGTVYQASMIDRTDTVLAAAALEFFYTENVASFYLNTASGSMDAIRDDIDYRETAYYFLLDENGERDAAGLCRVTGRGHSSWLQEKKPYNIELTEETSLLGMGSEYRWCLIANAMDRSQIKDRIVYEAAARMGVQNEPECDYVNLYCNGIYEGLYLLTQSVNGEKGCLKDFTSLQTQNVALNPSRLPYQAVEKDAETDTWKRYFALARNPENITGDYLLEFVDNGILDEEDYPYSYFRTPNRLVAIRSPRNATEAQADYIAAMVSEADEAIYGKGGEHPVSGKRFDEYLDAYSWARYYLFMDFFAYQDISGGSLFFLKKKDDDLLYCGPIWDYDKSMTDNFYDDEPFEWYDRAPILGWYSAMNSYPFFHERVVNIYRDEFSDLVGELLVRELPTWINELTPSMRMDDVRWGRENDYTSEHAKAVVTWLTGRKALFDRIWIEGEYSEYAENIY